MKSGTGSKKPTAFIVPHTHWDREWRYPIWKNRALLVRFMSRLLDMLDSDPAYATFVMDGQVVVIEDYLEVRPDDRTRIEKHVKNGRLKIGPWYTLPDLYPLDGECLVRNLLEGRRVSKKYGGYLEIGYNSFGWGQIAQFPQIYAGFGVNFVIAAKRVSKERAPDCEFWWEAPDGTRLLTSRLGKDSRANGFFQMYIPVRHGIAYRDSEYRWKWGKSGTVIHRAEPQRADDDYFRVDEASGYFPERIKDAIAEAWDGMSETLAPDFRLILTGSDFSSPLPALTNIVRDAEKAHPDKNFRMGTLEEYAGELFKQLDQNKLKVVRGELRDGPAFACSGNALSTRIYIKQLNKKAENSLLRRAEPLSSALSLLGETWPDSFINLAWKHLLQAHPHDSINGVTQDKTADDTVYRIEQAIELADVILEDSIQQLVMRIDYSNYSPDDQLILIYNSRPFPTSEIIEICVDTPREYSTWEIGILDTDETALSCQQVSRHELTSPVHDAEARPWPFRLDRHRLYVDTGVVPAGGYKLLRVVSKESFDRNVEWWPTMRTSAGKDIANSHSVLENIFLRAAIQADGSINLTDKTTGASFTDLHWFEDTGDVGDYWAYYPPQFNRTYSSKGRAAKIWLEENGPLAATVAIEIIMELPARAYIADKGAQGESSRSDKTVQVPITSRITLRSNARRLDIHTTIDNNAEDHRVRVMFPTNIETDTAESSGHFFVNSRPSIPPHDGKGEFWPEMQTLPQQMFVDASDGTKGLAILNDCLTEYQLIDDDRHTLALTLFRSVRNRICTEFRSSGNFPQQKGGQCLRRLEYNYAIYPHTGDWRKGGVYPEAMALNTPLTPFQISPCASSRGDLPTAASLFSISRNDLVLSAFKRTTDRGSHIIRMFNPADEPVTGTIQLYASVTGAWLVNLDETRLERIQVNDGKIQITVGPCKIVSIEIQS